jgi:hypothetical protein
MYLKDIVLTCFGYMAYLCDGRGVGIVKNNGFRRQCEQPIGHRTEDI